MLLINEGFGKKECLRCSLRKKIQKVGSQGNYFFELELGFFLFRQ